MPPLNFLLEEYFQMWKFSYFCQEVQSAGFQSPDSVQFEDVRDKLISAQVSTPKTASIKETLQDEQVYATYTLDNSKNSTQMLQTLVGPLNKFTKEGLADKKNYIAYICCFPGRNKTFTFLWNIVKSGNPYENVMSCPWSKFLSTRSRKVESLTTQPSNSDIDFRKMKLMIDMGVLY